MLSVALNEALSERAQGELAMAREDVEISAAVVHRLADPLLGAYRTLEARGRQLAAPPSVSPLNPEFFRGKIARQNAAWNQVLHRILFGSRSRYLHKVRVLEMTVRVLADHFHETAEDIADGVEIHPQESWSALDELHYDLNTCLRESVVMLKSFLRLLPDGSLETFRKELGAPTSVVQTRVRPKFSRVSS